MLVDEYAPPPPSLSSRLTFTLGLIVFLLLSRLAVRRAKFLYSLRNIPYPPALPLLGNFVQLLCNLEDFFAKLTEWAQEFGDIYLLWVGLRPFVFVYRMEAVGTLLSSRQHIDKSLEYEYLKPWLGSGLITSTGERWLARRKLLTPTFHSELLKGYFRVTLREADTFVECLRSEIGKLEFDIVPFAKRAALDTICVCAMGHQLNAQVNRRNDLTAISQRRFTSILLKPELLFKVSTLGREHDRALRVIEDFVNGVITDTKRDWLGSRLRRARASNNNERKPRPETLLDLLLQMVQNGEKLTDNDLRDEVNTFMFAGHDTVGMSVSWILYSLGRHPEYQERIIREVEDLLAAEGELGFESYNRLHWLGACVKEAWRLYPVTPLIARQINSPITLQNHDIPVGTTVLINSYLLHRDPRYFPEPERFKPERFLPGASKPPSFAFIPFSAGSRNCIGYKFATIEVKVTVLALLRAYRFRAILREDQLHLLSQVVLDNVGGIQLSITPRQPS
ncbi:cytochrome P450 4C1 isoform X2 [Nasonia vitripennis]|uniref:Cytochrome P450 n=1 Tax=Nasonia vitripennis TaxID=7425 RepID=A0A7M7IRN0_NASVI|nr:cytochrome P450 4C1 isoform X2 [Nasonia vitripennis]